MAVLKNFCKTLMLIFSTLLFSCESWNQSSESFETSENEVSVDTIPEITRQIVYKDFFLEEPLENGFRIGMLASEWNKQLALLAKSGFFNSLYGDKYYIGSVEYATNYDELGNEGYSVEGVFEEPYIGNEKTEVFRRNSKEINEPILISILYQYRINPSNCVTFINSLIAQKKLKFLAGEFPIEINFDPISTSEFQRTAQEEFAVYSRNKIEIEKFKRDKYVLFDKTMTSLFENEQCYAVLTFTETTSAKVWKNDDLFVDYIYSGKRRHLFSLNLLSKKQSNLNIDDYLTGSQKSEIEQKQRTQELINKALK